MGHGEDLSNGDSSRSSSPGHSSAISVSSPSHQELMKAYLPRLARDNNSHTNLHAAPRTPTDMMNQMRIEDARRERNAQATAQKRSGSTSVTSSPTFTSLPEYANTSASARAGTLYHQASHLAQLDRKEAQQAELLRRQFAGPVPTSWRKEDVQVKASKPIAASSDSLLKKRRRSTLAVRHFMGSNEKVGLTSLHDMASSLIISTICSSNGDIKEDVAALPLHLKDQMMSLAGREQVSEPLNETALRCLLLDNTTNSLVKTESLREDQVDSWDSYDVQTIQIPTSFTTLDLSYARIGFQTLKEVIFRPGQSNHLRKLSIAGWGSHEHTKQRSLSTLDGLMEAISSLGNLEMLSLANTKLYTSNQESAFQSKDEKVTETTTFLKRLSRSSLRLTVLDLSECDWILGSDISNLGWYSIGQIAIRSKIIWPRLQHLVMTNCRSFMEPGKEVEDELKPSPSFVGKWHAAHHGVSLVTDSPYFLEHRPGLGNSLFRSEEVNRGERRRRQLRQQNSSTSNAWDSQGEEEDVQEGDDGTPVPRHLSSSSGYPTRCPVSRAHVGPWEWERARLLDAVRGRWGSAIKGNVNSDTAQRGGSFIEVYF